MRCWFLLVNWSPTLVDTHGLMPPVPKATRKRPAAQAPLPRHEGDDRAARRVDERERHDRAELAPEDVGHDGADEREEVRARLEQRVERRRLRVADAQELRHVDGEDRVDAVVAEALGELVRDDERDARGHPVVAGFRADVRGGLGRGCVLLPGSWGARRLHQSGPGARRPRLALRREGPGRKAAGALRLRAGAAAAPGGLLELRHRVLGHQRAHRA